MKRFIRRTARTAMPLALCSMALAAMAAGGATAPGASATPAPAAVARTTPAIQPSETFSYERFGKVNVYRPKGAPREIVLFLSGDGGWTMGVLSMTQRLVDRGAVVAGIDNSRYLADLERAADKCVSPAVDLENLSHFLQSKLGLTTYLQPTLVGYSSGATLAYATLAEAPDGLFKGVLTLGFCTDLALTKPLCKGSGVESKPKADAHGKIEGVQPGPGEEGVESLDFIARATRSSVPRGTGEELHRPGIRCRDGAAAAGRSWLCGGAPLGRAVRRGVRQDHRGRGRRRARLTGRRPAAHRHSGGGRRHHPVVCNLSLGRRRLGRARQGGIAGAGEAAHTDRRLGLAAVFLVAAHARGQRARSRPGVAILLLVCGANRTPCWSAIPRAPTPCRSW